MNVNLAKLSVTKSIRDDGRITMEFRLWERGAEYPVSFMLHNERDIRQAIADLKGETEFTNYFDDLSYLVRFHAGGLIHVYLSPFCDTTGKYTGSYKQIYFSFPGDLLARDMLTLLNNADCIIVWNGLECNRLAKRYAPEPKWSLAPDVKHNLNHWIRNSPDKAGLKRSLQHLSRIAKNYSNGIDGNATVYLSLDHLPGDRSQSYYFDIRDCVNNRILNGGIIFHQSSQEYSTHT